MHDSRPCEDEGDNVYMPREALVSRNENPYDLGGSNIE
jgi:hypothetical protein